MVTGLDWIGHSDTAGDDLTLFEDLPCLSTFMTFIGMDTGDTLNCDTGGAGAGETGMSYSSVCVLGS